MKVKLHKIVTILSKYGLSWKDVANHIGKSKQSISEKVNKSKFTLDEMLKIVDFLKNFEENVDLRVFDDEE